MKIFKSILIVVVASVFSYADCDCNENVQINYKKIQQKVPERFEPVEKKLEEAMKELDKTIAEKEKELELVTKALDNKLTLAVMHEREVSQLTQMKEYLQNQNDAKTNSANIELNKNKNSIENNQLDSEEENRDAFWRK